MKLKTKMEIIERKLNKNPPTDLEFDGTHIARYRGYMVNHIFVIHPLLERADLWYPCFSL